MQNNWQDYQEIVDQIARGTLKRWMTGVELNDIRNELWASYFAFQITDPRASKREILRVLRGSAKAFKETLRGARGEQFKIKSPRFLDQLTSIDRRSKEWSTIRSLWDTYLASLPKKDAFLLRLVACGTARPVIARTLGITEVWVSNKKKALVAEFKRMVEDNVHTS